MQRPSRGQERQNAQSAWTKTSKELDRELRKHVLAEMRQSQAVEASVLAARKILPMNYLFERDIQECRDRMRRAVVDVLKRMQTQAKALAWRRWKRHLHLLELEETRNKAEMDLLIKQAKSLRTLERLARRALQGKPRVYLMHWKSQTNAMIDAERRSAAGTIQRCYRGHVGRRKAARRVAALERMRQRNSDAVCATAFLERRATLVRMYNAKRRARAAQCEAAAMRIQLLFRRYCAQRHVAFLANRKAGDLRLQQAAIKMQSAWRKRLALRAAHNVRDARRAVNIALGRKIAMRNRAALAITRVGRGAIGRQEARVRRLEWEYLSRAAERIQKFYRVKNGSYALSVRIAARREREKREAAARRQHASIVIQCFARRNRARKRAREARQAREILLARQNLAAERLQIFWWRCQGQYELARRCATRRDELARQNASATRIQKVIRGVQTRRRVTRFRTHTRAALVIQHLARSWLAIRKVNRKREQRRRRLARMATLIQNMVRVRAALKRTGELRRRRAATRIQCMTRSHFARAVRRQKARERAAATRIQARVRGMLARSFYQALREKTAATTLQTQVWRPILARSRVRQARTLENRARARREANLVWVLTRRTRCARVIQCRARILIARRRFLELVRAYRNEAACVIQRAVRVLLARCAVKRAYQEIAARKIQRFWQRILERRALQRRFKDRRKLLDRQDVCARTLQRVWRAHRGRKRFQQLLKLEKGRVIQEDYKHERKLKMEKDKERLARKEARQNRRREALGRFREEAYLTAVKSRTKLRETEGFQIPGWAENLCSLDLFERVLRHEKRRHEIDRAWTEVPVDETQPESDCYFYNELTGHSQWEVPDCIAQERAREARDAERSEKAAALVQAFEAKRTARPAETLLCRRNVPWVSALAMCNRPATIHCHHCNEVFCEACAERAHKRGPAKNHALLLISELENKSVCIVCENQLANRHCKPCGDDFCDNCWKLTHRTAAREKHAFEAYSRFTRPELEYGDRWCPYCDLAPAARNCKHCGDIYCVECYEEFHENGRRRTHVWTPANDYAVWKKLYDVASSRYYYFNTFTEESTWEKPAAILQREEDEDAGRPVTEGLRRVQEREAAENEESDNPIPGQIRVLEEEVAHLQEWKAEMDRQNEEDDAAEAEEAIRSFRSGAKAKKAQLFSFIRQKRTLEEEVFYEQKAYLERMLRDEATKDIGIDAALTGTELSRNAYEAKLLQDMAEARVAIRKDAHRQAVEQMSNDLFKKRVAKATKEFRGVSNSHQLVLECKKAGIKYGPDYLGAGKMTKTEAIEKLVIWRYEQEIEQKHRLEDQANLLKDTEKIRKRLARLEAGPGERAKGPASRFGGLFSRFPKA